MIDTPVVEVLNITQVPGVVFRQFRGEVDYPGMLEVVNSAKTADHLDRSDTLEGLRHNYAHLSNCDPYQDMLLAEVGQQVVAYGRSWWEAELAGDWVGWHFYFIHADHRDKEIGAPITSFLENRLTKIYAGLVASGIVDSSAPHWLSAMAFDSEVARRSVMQKAGYFEARYHYTMVRPDLEDIPELPLPEGLEIRPVLPEHYRAIWEADQEAFRDHWGYSEPTESSYQGWIEDPDFDPRLYQVAWDGDQVAGMVQAFINERENKEYNRLRGWTEGIAVRRPWRRRGLARALLTRALCAVKECGMQEAALGVDALNPNGALNLYESVGFRQVSRMTVFRKEF
jgi:GNAT superfamily N-acetyltransferase